nr:hypothetical protein [Strawberry virus 3]
MDPNEIPEIQEFHSKESCTLTTPSRVEKYKLTGSTTKIAHTQLDVRAVVCKNKSIIDSLKVWKTIPKCVSVKEIKIEWYPHVELNHVASMNVKIHNAYSSETRSRKNDLFFEGIFPINVHWSISVSSPRWITVEKYVCHSPWSYTITAKNMPQASLERAGEMCVSYTIEKGHKNKESTWVAPHVMIDPTPFPYLVPFYKYRSPGGLYESNLSVIRGVIAAIKKSLLMIGVNNTVTDDTIWAMANTVNADMQSQIMKMESITKGSSLETLESIITLIIADKNPGYIPYDGVIAMARDSIKTILSREISSIGEEMGSSSKAYLE